MKRRIAKLLLLAGLMGFVAPVAAETPLTVVELYTSQGCNSCPPADALLGDLAGRDDVLALSFHVDYWNYLGWKDRFSDPVYTRRQRDYSAKMRTRYVYTPQMVINGSLEHPGNDPHRVQRALSRAGAVELTPRMTATGDLSARVDLPDTPNMPLAIWVVGFDQRHDVAIAAGENHGRTISYHHVVRELQYLGSWDGKAKSMDIALDNHSDGGMAILLQEPDGGAVVGAAMLRF